MNNPNLIGVGKPLADGAVWIAPKGTIVPENLRVALGDPFKDFGYISDDGLTISEDGDSTEIAAWGAGTVKTIKTTYKETIQFTPIEINEVVLREQYGDSNVAIDTVEEGGTTFTRIVSKHRMVTLPSKVLVIKTCPTDDMMVVYVARNAQLTERGDLALNNDAQGREMTYTCNSDEDGVTITSYTFVKKSE